MTDVYFGTTTPVAQNLTNSLGVSTTIDSLNFLGTSGAVTISDTNTLTLMAGTGSNGINVAYGALAQTLALPVALGAAQNWTNNSANPLSVSGTVNNAGYLLTLNGTGAGGTAISGNIVGTGGLTDSVSERDGHPDGQRQLLGRDDHQLRRHTTNW